MLTAETISWTNAVTGLKQGDSSVVKKWLSSHAVDQEGTFTDYEGDSISGKIFWITIIYTSTYFLYI